ncbi:unnamed protein product [Hanseniaspora opuntiae]
MNYQITLKPQVLKIIPQIITHSKNDKFYAFDMDGTLIQTKGRSRFAVNADDWQWFKPRKALENQHNDMFSLVLIEKEMNSSFDKILKKKESDKKQTADASKYLHDIQDCTVKYKNNKIFITQFDSLDENKLLNVLKFDRYRKPNTGMLQEFYQDIETQNKIEYYVGDAAGRKNDFSDSDKAFAINGDLDFYTPEELFLMYPTDQKD